MEYLIFIGLFVVFFIVLNIQSRQKENADKLKKDFFNINKQLQELKDFLNNTVPQKEKNIVSLMQEKETAEKIAKEEYKQKLAAIEKLNAERDEQKKAEAEKQLLQPSSQIPDYPIENLQATEHHTNYTNEPFVLRETWSQKWIKNNPDLEKFIGENLFNKIGIAVLVFGIGFFVKYAIDQEWINEYGRVAIGLFCGTALISLAHYLRNSYRSFSSVLAGGGIAVFYFTIAFAFHQYHIIGQAMSFIIMITITAFAVALAILYNKIELAVIATVGGFLTPFLVATGSGNYIVLFSYLIILIIGLLALSYFKKWPLINILALFFTVLIFGGWLIQSFIFKNEIPPYGNGLLFASIFYLLFLGMNMIYNISRKKIFKPFDFFILLFINATYFTAGMVIMHGWNEGAYSGLFTIIMGFINLMLAFYFFKMQQADKNLLYFLIGLTLTFLTLAAPIQLHGHSITLFWSAETVLLFWLYQRSQIKLFKLSSAIIYILMMISLLMDWHFAGNKSFYRLPQIFINIQGIITNVVVIASIISTYFLLNKKQGTDLYFSGISYKTINTINVFLAIMLSYITLFFCINLHFYIQTNYTLPNIYHRILSNIFSLVLFYFFFPKYHGKKIGYVQIAIVFACFLFYAGSGNLINNLRSAALAGHIRYIHLMLHWISDITLLLLLYKGIQLVRKNYETLHQQAGIFTWVFSIALVFFFSFEVKQLYIVLFAKHNDTYVLHQQYLKAGLTILWGMSSFVMIWLGMKFKYKTLRVISLTLFAIALIKLFLFDIRNIGPGGKIAAFIMLGILLLIVSFMYQRLKKILIDDTIK